MGSEPRKKHDAARNGPDQGYWANASSSGQLNGSSGTLHADAKKEEKERREHARCADLGYGLRLEGFRASSGTESVHLRRLFLRVK